MAAGGKKIAAAGVLVALGIVVGIYLFVIKPFFQGKRNLTNDLQAARAKIIELQDQELGMPSQRVVDALAAENKVLDEEHKASVKSLSLQRAPIRLPEKKHEQVIYWKDSLKRTREEKTRKAALGGLEINTSLWFGDQLPTPEQVPDLLRHLEIVEELVDIAAAAKLIGLDSVEFIEGQRAVTVNPGGDFLGQVELEIRVRGGSAVLAPFMQGLNSAKHFFLVKSVSAESKQGQLETSIQLLTRYLKEEPAEPEGAKSS